MTGRPAHYALFDTDFGVCAIGWTGVGVSHFRLPRTDGTADEALVQKAMGTNEPSPPPDPVKDAIGLLKRYFAGEPIDFLPLVLDLSGSGAFDRAILAAARKVGWGEISSYGTLARQVANVGASQAVGQAMAHNPIPIIVPCHRILAADGSLGGFSAPGGVTTKKRLLEMEGSAKKVPALAQLGFGF